MHTDERYGHHLGVQLQHEVDEVHAPPGLVAVLRRRQARRTWAVRAAIATPVAAAAAAVILLGQTGPGAPNRVQPAGNAPSSPVQLRDVAYIQAQTIRAVSQAPQYVIYQKDAYGGGYYEVWTDRGTQRYRLDLYGRSSLAAPSGRLVAPPSPGQESLGPVHLQQSNSAVGPNGNRERFFVDYDLKTWSRSHDSKLTPKPVVPDPTDPDGIQAALNDGTLTLVGPETLNGRQTLHLRMFATHRGYRIDMWVDAATYLPVQETQRVIGAPDQDAPAVTTTYSWLPRTEENLAKLVLTAPPGFRRV